MKISVNKTKFEFGLSYDGKIKKEYKYYITVLFDKPVDSLALKYSMLVCCDDFVVAYPRKYVIGNGNIDCSLFEKHISTPKTLEEFLKIDDVEFALSGFGKSYITTDNPAKPNEVYVSLISDKKIDSTEYVKLYFLKAVDMYDQLRRNITLKTYQKITINSIDVIKTESDESNHYSLLLSDHEKINLIKTI